MNYFRSVHFNRTERSGRTNTGSNWPQPTYIGEARGGELNTGYIISTMKSRAKNLERSNGQQRRDKRRDNDIDRDVWCMFVLSSSGDLDSSCSSGEKDACIFHWLWPDKIENMCCWIHQEFTLPKANPNGVLHTQAHTHKPTNCFCNFKLSFIVQRLCVDIRRGNAICVHGTMDSTTNYCHLDNIYIDNICDTQKQTSDF